MTQIEFVTELEQALRGNVEERIIQENVRYYNDYISEQRAAGKSEEEIFCLTWKSASYCKDDY